MQNSRAEPRLPSIDDSPFAAIITDNRHPDNVIIAANDRFCELTSYPKEEILGRNCRFLQGAATEREAQAELRTAISQNRSTVVEMWNYRKDGRPFRNAVMIAPILDAEGKALYYVGSQMEIEDAGSSGLRSDRAIRMVQKLTRKQRDVLTLMVHGMRNRGIGDHLGIGEPAVKRLRSRLVHALGVDSPVAAIRVGVEAGLTGVALPEKKSRV